MKLKTNMNNMYYIVAFCIVILVHMNKINTVFVLLEKNNS